MLRVAPRRRDRGFTMLELIVSVGLMVVLLSVLAFVFRQSAEAVSQATEAVNTMQKARNFEARLGRELAAAVQYVVEGVSLAKPQRAFRFDENGVHNGSQGDPDSAAYGTQIEFVSRTLQDGVMKTWDVKYIFVMDPGETYGSITRKKDAPNPDANGEYVLWDQLWVEDQDEVIAWPVTGVSFQAAGNWLPEEDVSGDENTELPPYVQVDVTFLDKWGGQSFRLPMTFYFPIYQGD